MANVEEDTMTGGSEEEEETPTEPWVAGDFDNDYYVFFKKRESILSFFFVHVLFFSE